MQISRSGSRFGTRFATLFQNRHRLNSYLLKVRSQEIVMARSPGAHRTLRIAAAAALAGVLWSGAALASQGPGGGPGTASHFTQLAMAILVYGTAALVVGAGLIGAVTQPRRQ
jgi:hypothetical protein